MNLLKRKSRVEPSGDSTSAERHLENDQQQSSGNGYYVSERKEEEAAAESGSKSAAGQRGGRFRFPHIPDSLIAVLSYNVNLYSVWKLPYLTGKYGGAAFLLVYALFIFVGGYPLYYLEMAMGQISGQGVLTVWNCLPLFKGVGYAALLGTFLICTYYAVFLSWSLYYFCISLTVQLPFTDCAEPWKTLACSKFSNCTTKVVTTTCRNGTSMYRFGNAVSHNSTHPLVFPEVWKFPAEEYFHHQVLSLMPAGIGHSGIISWQLLLCLLFVWILVFLCLIFGAKSAAKVSYVTLFVSYVLWFTLFVRVILVPGGVEGLKFYLSPDFCKLKDIKLWGDAALLVFFTLFTNWGTISTLFSFERETEKFYQDAFLASLGCLISSVVLATVPCIICGILAKNLNIPVDQLVSYGPSLLFAAVAQGFVFISASPIWSSLFYLFLLFLGISTLVWMVETIVTSIVDCGSARLQTLKLTVLLAVLCLQFILGLSMIFRSGLYVVILFETYAGTWNVLLLAFIEMCAISGLFGVKNFLGHVADLLGTVEPGRAYCWIWQVVWAGFTPCLLAAMVLYSAICWQPAKYGDYTLEAWAQALGWVLVIVPLALVPAFMIITYVTAEGSSVKEKIRNSLKPKDPVWGGVSESTREHHQMSSDPGLPPPYSELPEYNGGRAEVQAPAAAYLPDTISATEHGAKLNKINRATQMTKEIETQTGTDAEKAVDKERENRHKRRKEKKHGRKKHKQSSSAGSKEEEEGPGTSGVRRLPPLVHKEDSNHSTKYKSSKSEADAKEKHSAEQDDQQVHFHLPTTVHYENPDFEADNFETRKSL